MVGGVFVIQADDSLVELAEAGYGTEDVLQGLLAKYPNLLAGDQIDSESPRRWLLISRETALPAEEGGGWQFSVDHLLLDQDAIPTLVEVKQASDTRARREVVAQMLDYAANAVAYGPVRSIQAQFEERCRDEGRDPQEELLACVGSDVDAQEFWERAKTNLQAGRIRLVFVADQIHKDLKRIVEFLNEQMDPAEVLAIEVRQFAGEGVKVLVPAVIGKTETAAGRKGGQQRTKWNEQSFLADLDARYPEGRAGASAIIEWAKQNNCRFSYGTGEVAAFTVGVLVGDVWAIPACLYASGTVGITFRYMNNKPRFSEPSARLGLLREFNKVPGVSIDDTRINGEPMIDLALLSQPETRDAFIGALDWFATQVKAAGAEGATTVGESRESEA
jgi:hypothetical protein